MPFLFPGIHFDPREPIPPGFENYDLHLAAQADVQFHDAGHNHPDPVLQVHPHKLQLNEHDQHEQRGFLPPLSATVNIQIVHDTAKFTVTHLFRNQSSAIKQGVYHFPLPLEATVTEFNCRIGTTRIIRGKVKPKEDARRDFDNAVRQDRTGGLVEQQTAEVFRTTLGNIPANTEMRAELSFVCLLKHRTSVDREVFTLIVPTYIAPRYGDLPPGVQAGDQGLQFLGLEVDLLTAEELVSVNSDTHTIAYQRGAGQRLCQRWEDFIMRRDDPSTNLRTAVIKLEEGRTTLDKDLILTIDTALANNAETPQACLEIHPRFENHKAIMLSLPSNFMLQAETFSHDGEIIFVADRSGSMSDKIESLKSAMMFFINGIPENRPFNIWCFGSNFTSMWQQSRAFNEANKREATDYVRKEFASDMGGTEILPALRAIYNARVGYHSMDVIVLTDGQVWEPAKTINFVKEKWKMSEGMIRFFSLGIGAAVSHELVEGIAKAGGGYAEVITSASGGGWEDRIVAMLKAATTGHIGLFQMELEWQKNQGFEGLQLPNYQQSPVNVSAISPFIRNRVFILFDSGTQSPGLEAVVLKARGANGVNVTKRVPLRQLHLPDSTIHKLAVRALLGDLERGDSRLHQSRPIDVTQATFDQLVRDEAVNLGCKWSLVSKWTSLYAVEEEIAEPNDEGMGLDFEDARANDELWDALLLPRGALNLNAGRLLAGARVGAELGESEDEESGSETDSTDLEPRSRFGGRSSQSDDSDDSDGGHNNPGHGAGGGNAGDAGIDKGSGDNGQQRERDPPRDGVPRNDAQGHSRGGKNLDRTSFPRAESAEPTPTEFGLTDWSRPLPTVQQSQGWESTASREPIMPSVPPVPASQFRHNPFLHSSSYSPFLHSPSYSPFLHSSSYSPFPHSSSYSPLESPRSGSTWASISDQDSPHHKSSVPAPQFRSNPLPLRSPGGRRAGISGRDSRLSDRDSRLSDLDFLLSDLDSRLSDHDSRLGDRDSRLGNLDSRLSNCDFRLSNRDSRISDLDSRLSDRSCKSH